MVGFIASLVSLGGPIIESNNVVSFEVSIWILSARSGLAYNAIPERCNRT